MRLGAIYVGMLLITLVGAMYIPDPRNRDLLIPVRLDQTRPRVRLQQVLIEDAPNGNRIYELLYLIFAVPLLFTGRFGGGMFGSRDDDSGNGNGGVITQNPCC